MNAPPPSRLPWVMLALFCAAAVLFFISTAGPDLGLLRGGPPAAQQMPVTREVRMPIVFETPQLLHHRDKKPPHPSDPPVITEGEKGFSVRMPEQ